MRGYFFYYILPQFLLQGVKFGCTEKLTQSDLKTIA